MAGILILEGADASGKSTLASYLREHYGARWVRTHPARDQWRHHMAAYLRATRLAADGHLVVVERHWISECAYAAALAGHRGPCQYPIAARCFDRLWLRASALYVMCVPADPRAQLARHAAGVPGKRETFDRVEPVIAFYDNLMRGNGMHPGDTYLDKAIRFDDFRDRPDVIRYDPDAQGATPFRLNLWTMALLDRLKRYRAKQLPIAASMNFGGHAGHHPRYVMVGETTSEAITHRRASFPFVDRDTHESAATHLNRALHQLAVDETDLLWVNAVGPELKNVVEARPDPAYIALGRVADNALRDLGVKDRRYLIHPGWARRFAYTDDYAKLLEGTLR